MQHRRVVLPAVEPAEAESLLLRLQLGRPESLAGHLVLGLLLLGRLHLRHTTAIRIQCHNNMARPRSATATNEELIQLLACVCPGPDTVRGRYSGGPDLKTKERAVYEYTGVLLSLL